MALLIEQRDRFVAFAFAAAEVLCEVDREGRIGFVAGGVKALIGADPAVLSGKSLSALVVEGDRFLVGEHLVRLQQSTRAADMIVSLEHPDGRPLPVLVSGMKSPQRADVFHIVMRRLPMVPRGEDRQILVSPVTARDFVAAAAELGRQAAQSDEKPQLALYEIDLGMVRKDKGAKEADSLETSMIQSMRAWASGSGAVGRTGQGRYSLLLDQYTDHAALGRRLGDVAKARGADVNVGYKLLDITDALEDETLPMMLARALDQFQNKGLDGVTAGRLGDIAGKADQATNPARPGINARRKGTKESWG